MDDVDDEVEDEVEAEVTDVYVINRAHGHEKTPPKTPQVKYHIQSKTIDKLEKA